MQVISKGKNGEFRVTPLRIDSKAVFGQSRSSQRGQSCSESPCLKKEFSSASTLDSPLSMSSGTDEKQISGLPELCLEELCQSFHQNGYCMHGTECTLIHGGREEVAEHGGIVSVKMSTVLLNFPELLTMSPLLKRKSILY